MLMTIDNVERIQALEHDVGLIDVRSEEINDLMVKLLEEVKILHGERHAKLTEITSLLNG